MAISTSRFIQLRDEILVEYIYSAQEPSDFISTTDYPIWMMEETDLNERQLMFDDSKEIETNNVRDLSVIKQTQYYFTSLDIDVPLPYNDSKASITDTVNLNVNFAPPQQYVLETVKFHMLTGFDFPNMDGIILKASVKDKEQRELILCQVAWLKSDNNFSINTNPFLIGDRLYDKYLEVKIVGISQVSTEFELNPLDSDNIGYKVTRNNLGIDINTTIKFESWEISNIAAVGLYKNYYATNYTVSSLPRADDFFALGATLKESEEGDYFEYFATWNGEFIEDHLFRLNSVGNNYIIIHEIATVEQIGNTFLQTGRFTDVQLTKFGEPNTFRPVIKNANSAISYSLEYLMRMFNKNDNSQIIRKTSFTSLDVNKYGKYLARIQLGINNEPLKVYNKIVKGNEFNVPNIENKVGMQVKQVPVFIENKNIVIQSGSINDVSADIYTQGNAQIVLDIFDNIVRFVLSEQQGAKGDETVKLLKLSPNVTYELVFLDSNDAEIVIASGYDKTNMNLSSGELYFKVLGEYSKRILKSNNKKFYIVSNSEGLRNRLYQGVWVGSESELTPKKSDIATELAFDEKSTKTALEKQAKDLETKKKINESNIKKDETGTKSWKDISPID